MSDPYCMLPLDVARQCLKRQGIECYDCVETIGKPRDTTGMTARVIRTMTDEKGRVTLLYAYFLDTLTHPAM